MLPNEFGISTYFDMLGIHFLNQLTVPYVPRDTNDSLMGNPHHHPWMNESPCAMKSVYTVSDNPLQLFHVWIIPFLNPHLFILRLQIFCSQITTITRLTFRLEGLTRSFWHVPPSYSIIVDKLKKFIPPKSPKSHHIEISRPFVDKMFVLLSGIIG